MPPLLLLLLLDEELLLLLLPPPPPLHEAKNDVTLKTSNASKTYNPTRFMGPSLVYLYVREKAKTQTKKQIRTFLLKKGPSHRTAIGLKKIIFPGKDSPKSKTLLINVNGYDPNNTNFKQMYYYWLMLSLLD
jgi:hypothetical protein